MLVVSHQRVAKWGNKRQTAAFCWVQAMWVSKCATVPTGLVILNDLRERERERMRREEVAVRAVISGTTGFGVRKLRCSEDPRQCPLVLLVKVD
jgi:hypothetical protein